MPESDASEALQTQIDAAMAANDMGLADTLFRSRSGRRTLGRRVDSLALAWSVNLMRAPRSLSSRAANY